MTAIGLLYSSITPHYLQTIVPIDSREYQPNPFLWIPTQSTLVNEAVKPLIAGTCKILYYWAIGNPGLIYIQVVEFIALHFTLKPYARLETCADNISVAAAFKRFKSAAPPRKPSKNRRLSVEYLVVNHAWTSLARMSQRRLVNELTVRRQWGRQLK